MSSHRDETRIRVYFCRNAASGGGMPISLARLEARNDVTIEPVPCSGRIDPRYLLRAVESGAEAVCVLTCAHGHCKRMEGNLRATKRIQAVRELIAEAGADPETIRVFLPDDSGPNAVEAAARRLVQFVEAVRDPSHKVAVAR